MQLVISCDLKLYIISISIWSGMNMCVGNLLINGILEM